MSGEVTSRIVVVGMSVRVPGADGVRAFEEMLFAGRTGYVDLPSDRCDRLLYFDPAKGKTGKTYTTLGGVVPERPVNQDICPLPTETQRLYDAAHVQFAEVAATAWMDAGLQANDGRLQRTGVYVGHSGGTKSGGGLSLGTQIEEALSFVDDLDSFRQLPKDARRAVIDQVIAAIRQSRPVRQVGSIPNFHAYQAASLAARVLGLTGPRSVIDAACASSLVAMHQAMMAIRAGRIDSAIVGGATYNNVDNLILFSHSQACTATDSRPFDDGASGLVSSEGYVAVVITTEDIAEQHGLPILGVIRGVGMASDGKGRSLWAPRLEGQVLALQRAYFASGELEVLDIDYMEAHATSTQLGDATELETLRHLADRSPSFQRRRARSQGLADRLLLGSVKSNIGHTLEAAGLIGLVKVLLSMHRNQVAPSLRFENPNRNYDWSTSPVRVVTQPEAWPTIAADSRPKRAAVSAFGIGGLNAHVVVEAYEGSVRRPARTDAAFRSPLSSDPIAIVGRGLVVAGAKNVAEFASLMQSDQSAIVDAPADRWRNRAGVETHHGPTSHKSPHCRGGFVTDFVFDGAKYRIPPKQVQQANPVQMMLIDAVSQALADVNSSGSNGNSGVSSSSEHWPFDRQRVGVVIGTIFGGEFGDQLQVGMRLPEICEQMIAAMLRRGVSAEKAQSIADDYRRNVLKNRPALLDETGSFTASTLASRVAKTFDLMGGAAALDSDDSSGLAALMVAVDQLKTGSLDMILCGSAQRSMSLAAYEALDMTGRLVRSGRIEDIPNDCRQIIPGEGVVTLMLCRLSDAERLELPIYGVLDDVQQATPSVGSSNEVLNSADAEIVRRIGYLAGAHSLIRLVAETLQPTGDKMVAAKTNDGIVLQTTLQTDRSRIRQNSMGFNVGRTEQREFRQFEVSSKEAGTHSVRSGLRSPNSDESGYGSGGAANREPPPIGDVGPIIKTNTLPRNQHQ